LPFFGKRPAGKTVARTSGLTLQGLPSRYESISGENIMTQKIELHGRIISKGVAEGEALVCRSPLSFMASAIANETGMVRIHGHELEGKCVKDKVVVYDTDQFSTGASLSFYTKCTVYKTGPAAVICREMHNITGGAAIYCEVPAMDAIREGIPCDLIRTGDWVKVDAIRGVIEVTRK